MNFSGNEVSVNEVLQAIKKRRTCRSFTNQTVEKEKLEAIALAGAQAPSAINQQRWRILVTSNKDIIDSIDNVILKAIAAYDDQSTYERIKSRGEKVFYDAPTLLLVLTNDESALLDCGIVVENMALAATSLGLGNCINAMCRIAFVNADGTATTEAAALKEQLLWPKGYNLAIGLLVGYSAVAGEPHVPDPDKIIWS